ncbi:MULTISPECIES: helix-turn-helix domain-containing protein [Photorhabdus]|uniref:Helix-turn-helix transcriptional regulator n=2 Tax=Photorhabdus TaxID=29487 RepID=A0AAW6BQM1_9GAMM|nr:MULTISPECIES: helix-turn-helix transcriptional regulator [Photorhabdus]EYU13634.1 transcriptional regulator, Nlp family [Photorhabdus aegyptia]MDB6373970.1 helix-turn-helix transcriptional regulator [Photorhabdus bodei]
MKKGGWQPADIITGLKKQGTSLSVFSRESGLASCMLNNALHRPWPNGERLIATTLSCEPCEIWPSRYLK